MEDKTVSLECTCGKYSATFDFQSIAERAAEMHVMLGPEHVVTGTRPAFNTKGSIPVILFTCRKEA